MKNNSLLEKLVTLVGLPVDYAIFVANELVSGNVIVCRESDIANGNGYHGAQFYRYADGKLYTARKNYPINDEWERAKWHIVGDNALLNNAQVRYELAHCYDRTFPVGVWNCIAPKTLFRNLDGYGKGEMHFDYDPADLA